MEDKYCKVSEIKEWLQSYKDFYANNGRIDEEWAIDDILHCFHLDHPPIYTLEELNNG